MTKRRNQYQRRQAQRRDDQLLMIAILITLILFARGYVLLRDPLSTLMNHEVLASNGTRTLGQIQDSYLLRYGGFVVIGFAIMCLLIRFVLLLIARRRFNSFAFGTSGSEKASNEVHTIDYSQVSPREFEEQVAQLIRLQTGLHTEVVGKSRDNGADIVVYDSSRKLVGVVQCKRYNPSKALDPRFIREMATVRQMHKVNIAYLATTAYFTDESKRLAKQLNIKLIEGCDLERIARQYRRS